MKDVEGRKRGEKILSRQYLRTKFSKNEKVKKRNKRMRT